MPQAKASSSRLQQEDLLKEGPHSDSRESVGSSIEGSTDERPDAPRVAQWVDEEELEDDLSSATSESEQEDLGLAALKRDLSKLPLGALIKARKAVKAAAQDSDQDDSEASDSSQESKVEHNSKKGENGSIPTPKERRTIEHRSNKHAPMEVTSKKAVTRRRQVVEVHRVKPRDPRFSDLSGNLSVDQFRSHYDFLPTLHTSELSTLKQSLARARKLLISSPRHLRPEREEEVQRLELAVKKAESTVNRERREEAERNALAKIHQEEKEKRRAGKKDWYMKDADKKVVRVRARLDAIAASGGKRAVKKAIEKKQRKVGQKEKKSRPFAPTERASGSQKRPREDGGGHERHVKRPRVNR